MAHRSDLEALPAAYRGFHDALARVLPAERLVADPLRTFAFGTDASFYRLVPKLVVRPRDVAELSAVLAAAAARGIPLTFRTAGTSLSGQAVTDSVLVLLAGGWRGARVHPGAERITLEPGVVGADANALLAPHGRKIGPDPASIGACMIGGIAANNASGMCCGTSQSSYRTVESMRIVLWDGTVLDTADAASRRAFAAAHPELLAGLAAIRDEIAADAALAERIRAKYRIKNTTGYSLNAFVDFHDPVDVLLHLMIGSEGTLGFIAEITYRTVPELPHRASALVAFPDVESAARATVRLQGGPASSAELMDRASLRAVEGRAGLPGWLATLGPDACALLVETRATDPGALAANVEEARRRLLEVRTLLPVEFTDRKEEYERLWDVRRGLFPAVGAARPVGTTVVIEDVAFQMEHLAAATVELQGLMRRHGYDEGILFGHALDGNLHFVFTQDFARPEEVERYARFMDDVCAMVTKKYDGSLKGEHGTGRNVAPFVALEWGEAAWGLMWRVKRLLDPKGILNPGVVLNEDPRLHLADLKPLPAADDLVDRCTECGFCEPKCPSRALTLTPRQRITTRREIARLERAGVEPARRARLEEDYVYLGEETCATDGLCATACPVAIDTGELTKRLRAAGRGDRAKAVAAAVADHFAGTSAAVRAGLRVAGAVRAVAGAGAVAGLSRGLRAASGGRLPVWNAAAPGATRAPRLADVVKGRGRRVVYFPSCVARTMGPAAADPDQRALFDATLSLLDKAGYDVLFPKDVEALCCGLTFDSKGFPELAAAKALELEGALLERTEGGRIPVLADTSPCLQRMRKTLDPRLALHEPGEFIHDFLLPELRVVRREGTIALHVTCSAAKLGLAPKLRAVAGACAERVVVPGVGCCAFAGDRGFTHPELNASALSGLAAALPEGCERGYSNSRTCEIGLSLHGGIPFQSIVFLVDRCTAPRERGPLEPRLVAARPEQATPPTAPVVPAPPPVSVPLRPVTRNAAAAAPGRGSTVHPTDPGPGASARTGNVAPEE
jgi:D-lactate dehydrogenase